VQLAVTQSTLTTQHRNFSLIKQHKREYIAMAFARWSVVLCSEAVAGRHADEALLHCSSGGGAKQAIVDAIGSLTDLAMFLAHIN
jgi:hypothetical protein